MAQEKFFDTGKVKINYLEYGSASVEPMVMLHEEPGAGKSIFPSFQAYLRDAYICFGSERKRQIRLAAEQYRLEDFTEDTVEFLRQLKAPAVLVDTPLAA